MVVQAVFQQHVEYEINVRETKAMNLCFLFSMTSKLVYIQDKNFVNTEGSS